jgi:hypothetical protein
MADGNNLLVGADPKCIREAHKAVFLKTRSGLPETRRPTWSATDLHLERIMGLGET